jgi:hypothetical protein
MDRGFFFHHINNTNDSPTKGLLEADVFHLKTNVLVLADYYSPEDLLKVQYLDMNYM